MYRVFLQGNHQNYGHKRCIYTVLAKPTCMAKLVIAVFPNPCDTFLSISASQIICQKNWLKSGQRQINGGPAGQHIFCSKSCYNERQEARGSNRVRSPLTLQTNVSSLGKSSASGRQEALGRLRGGQSQITIDPADQRFLFRKVLLKWTPRSLIERRTEPDHHWPCRPTFPLKESPPQVDVKKPDREADRARSPLTLQTNVLTFFKLPFSVNAKTPKAKVRQSQYLTLLVRRSPAPKLEACVWQAPAL